MHSTLSVWSILSVSFHGNLPVLNLLFAYPIIWTQPMAWLYPPLPKQPLLLQYLIKALLSTNDNAWWPLPILFFSHEATSSDYFVRPFVKAVSMLSANNASKSTCFAAAAFRNYGGIEGELNRWTANWQPRRINKCQFILSMTRCWRPISLSKIWTC